MYLVQLGSPVRSNNKRRDLKTRSSNRQKKRNNEQSKGEKKTNRLAKKFPKEAMKEKDMKAITDQNKKIFSTFLNERTRETSKQ